jgi:hypothetical protein
MLRALNHIRMLLLASWLGAAIFFSAAVAPSAFRILRAASLPNAGELAGSIVNRALSVINIGGFVFSLLLLISAPALRKSYRHRIFTLQLALLLIVAAATGVGEWVIAARMRGLRAATGFGINQLPATDATRVAFDALHGYSVAALSVAIIAGLIAFFVIGRSKFD